MLAERVKRLFPHPDAAGVLATLAGCFVCLFLAEPEFRADAASYYVYVRSALLDHDLDFTNEWEHWGFDLKPLTGTGHRPNTQPVGPAIVWSPFVILAHFGARLAWGLGSRRYSPDGYSAPYLTAVNAATVVGVVIGAWLLVLALRSRLPGAPARLATAAAILASPIVYYTFVVPGMAHGLAFASASACLWAWDRAERAPTVMRWTVLGALTGLVALLRWQAVVFALLPIGLAVKQAVQRRLSLRAAASTVAAAGLVFAPQLVVWRILYGSYVTLPQGQDFMDWTSPHLMDVLVSAERGFFNWTPLMLAGVFGLLLLLRAETLLAAGALAVFLATAWVNGGVRDWEASDAFGARRFDMVVPLMALGLAAVGRSLAALLSRRPGLAFGAFVSAAVAWNLGMIQLYRDRVLIDAAPVHRMASAQVQQVRRVLDDAAAAVLGPRGSALVYRVFIGEYFYYNINPSGTIDVGAVESPFLIGDGWSGVQRREGWPAFRWARFPNACVRVPLLTPIDLRSFVRIRAPARIPDQSMRVIVNGQLVESIERVEPEWTEVRFMVPVSALVPGQNLLCFEFSRGLPGSDDAAAAAISLIQLP